METQLNKREGNIKALLIAAGVTPEFFIKRSADDEIITGFLCSVPSDDKKISLLEEVEKLIEEQNLPLIIDVQKQFDTKFKVNIVHFPSYYAHGESVYEILSR